MPGDSLNVAAGLIGAIAVMTLILGAVGALLHDQVEEIGAYSIIQDAAFVLLAFASCDPDAAQPTRVWLLAFVAAKFGLLAWVAATSWAFGSSNLTQLRGWARRAPILGVALAAVVVATVGWPGNAVFEARSSLIGLSLPSQLGMLGPIAILLTLAVYARIFVVGLLAPGDRVMAADGERPRWPAGPGLAADATSGHGAADAARRIFEAVKLNRTIRASLLVLVLGAMAVVLAMGGFGASGATQTGIALDQVVAPIGAGPSGDNGGPTTAPVETPVSTAPAGVTSGSPGPSASASAAAIPAGSAPASALPSAPTGAPTASASPSANQTTGD
jgi:formate hydrogenlyase subunit 3/multisubunit Na+/H+ antiporter MnhD subunit